MDPISNQSIEMCGTISKVKNTIKITVLHITKLTKIDAFIRGWSGGYVSTSTLSAAVDLGLSMRRGGGGGPLISHSDI